MSGLTNTTTIFTRSLGRHLLAGLLAFLTAVLCASAAESDNAHHATLAKVTGVTAVAAPGDGNVYIADSAKNRILKWRLSDGSASVFTSERISQPVALAFDSQKRLVVANAARNEVTAYRPTGELDYSIEPPPYAGAITAAAIDTQDHIYIAHANGQVTQFTPAGALVTVYHADPGADLRGLAVDLSGAVYSSDAARHVIWKWSAPGASAVHFAGALDSPGKTAGGISVGQLHQPQQLAFSTNGILIVADRGNHQVRAVQKSGEISVLVGIDSKLWFRGKMPDVTPGLWDSAPQYAELRNPVALSFDPHGNLYTAEAFYEVVRVSRNLVLPRNDRSPATTAPAIALSD